MERVVQTGNDVLRGQTLRKKLLSAIACLATQLKKQNIGNNIFSLIIIIEPYFFYLRQNNLSYFFIYKFGAGKEIKVILDKNKKLVQFICILT